MKKLLAILGGLIVLIIVVAVVTPFLIPTETYKNQVQKQISAATGRDLTISGDVGFSLLPSTELTVSKVAFANAEWAAEPYMARLDGLRVKVDPWALLGGELKIQSFVLERPVIQLSVNKDGTPNWQLGAAGGEAAQAPAEDGAAPTQAPLRDITLEDVRLVDGRVTYSDAVSGAVYDLTAVNLSLALEALDQPFSAEGSLVYNGEKLDVTLDTGAPRALMAGESTPVTLDLDSAPIQVNYDGSLTNATPQKLDGRVTLTIPSVKGLAAWAGQPIEAAEGTLETFELEGRVNAEGPRYAFQAERLLFDKIEGEGELAIDLSGAKPALTGELNLARLDVTPYMPPPTEPAEGDAGGDGTSEAASTEWSDEPIDVSALNSANVDFDLSVDSIKAREIEVGESALGVRLRDGELVANLNKLALYDGAGTGRVVVDSRPETPKMALAFDLQGISARPLLTAAAGFERLEGSGNLAFDVASQGGSQKALVEGLNGQGAIRFTDGAIVGINLAKMVRNVGSAFSGGGDEAQKTDFAELAGTFTITDGVLTNDDLLMLNPLLRVRGAGTANLPARTADYRVTPKAVASLEGQGGDVQETGVAVPVIIKGPWHNLTYRPDLESVLKDAITSPEKVKESAQDAVKSLKGAGGDLGETLKGLTGGSGQSGNGTSGDAASGDGEAQPDVKQQLKDAGDKLKGLFD
jgi:AsmA protein